MMSSSARDITGMNAALNSEREEESFRPRKSMSGVERRASEKLEDILQLSRSESLRSMNGSISNLEIPSKRDDQLRPRRRKSGTQKGESFSSKKSDVCFWYLTQSTKRDSLCRSLSVNDERIMSRRLDALEVKSRGHSRPRERLEEASGTSTSNNLCESIEKQDWKGALAILENHPEKARQMQRMKLHGTGETCGLPLHLAMSKNPPKKFVADLLSACPAGASVRDEKFGRLPIHIFCICNTASGTILQLLVAAYPKSAKVGDRAEGRIPLHYSCLYGSPYVISMLVEADLESISCKDFQQKTPLHLAQEGSNSHKEAIVKRLAQRQKSLICKQNVPRHNKSSASVDLEQFARIASDNNKKWKEAHTQATISLEGVESSMDRLKRLNKRLRKLQEKINEEQAILEKAKERAREEELRLDELTNERKLIEKMERDRIRA